MSKQRKFITTCTLTFKAFDFEVTMTEGKNSIWNFTTKNPNTSKKYAVFCASTVKKVSGLIKVALKKLPSDSRLVVVVEEHNEKELEQANEQNFCLVTLDLLNQYGQEMLDIREKKSAEDLLTPESRAESLIDKVIQKDRLF